MTCMTLVLLGNYSQTGHFGGPLAYTPFNVAVHLAGPELGGLRRLSTPEAPVRRQVHAGRGSLRADLLRALDDPRQALYTKLQATGDRRYYVSPSSDAAHRRLGFRAAPGAQDPP